MTEKEWSLTFHIRPIIVLLLSAWFAWIINLDSGQFKYVQIRLILNLLSTSIILHPALVCDCSSLRVHSFPWRGSLFLVLWMSVLDGNGHSLSNQVTVFTQWQGMEELTLLNWSLKPLDTLPLLSRNSTSNNCA